MHAAVLIPRRKDDGWRGVSVRRDPSAVVDEEDKQTQSVEDDGESGVDTVDAPGLGIEFGETRCDEAK